MFVLTGSLGAISTYTLSMSLLCNCHYLILITGIIALSFRRPFLASPLWSLNFGNGTCEYMECLTTSSFQFTVKVIYQQEMKAQCENCRMSFRLHANLFVNLIVIVRRTYCTWCYLQIYYLYLSVSWVLSLETENLTLSAVLRVGRGTWKHVFSFECLL